MNRVEIDGIKKRKSRLTARDRMTVGIAAGYAKKLGRRSKSRLDPDRLAVATNVKAPHEADEAD